MIHSFAIYKVHSDNFRCNQWQTIHPLQWRHNERDGVSNHQRQACIQAQIKKTHQSSASLAFVRGIRRSPVNSPHKGLVTRQMLQFDDVIMKASVSVNAGWVIHGVRSCRTMCGVSPSSAWLQCIPVTSPLSSTARLVMAWRTRTPVSDAVQGGDAGCFLVRPPTTCYRMGNR